MTTGPVPTIRSIATSVPPNRVTQTEAENFAARIFEDRLEGADRLLSVFRNSRVECRHLCRPLEWFATTHTFPETNAVYAEAALELAVEASGRAIEQAGIAPSEVAMVLLVSSTGISTPSLDCRLIQSLGLSCHTPRLPIWGLGCAGGVAGLARAAELCNVVPGRCVLLVAVEVCSTTFQEGDASKANLVATSLFGDGAAAVVLTLADDGGPELLGSHSRLFADSEDIMGWDLVESGLKVRFSRSIPSFVEQQLADVTSAAFAGWSVQPNDVRHFVLHPGGPRVLDAYAASLELSPARLVEAYDILGRFGNMSSPTVLFVLERYLANVRASHDLGIIVALGPGFSAETVLFRW